MMTEKHFINHPLYRGYWHFSKFHSATSRDIGYWEYLNLKEIYFYIH